MARVHAQVLQVVLHHQSNTVVDYLDLVSLLEVMWACLSWRPLVIYLTLTGVVGTTIGRTKKARQLKVHWNRQDDSRTKTKKDIHQPMASYDTL